MSVQVTRVKTEHRVLISSTLSSAVVSLDSTEPFVTKVGMFRHKNSLYMLIAYQWFSWLKMSVSIRKLHIYHILKCMFFQQTLMSVQVSRVRTEHRVLISSTLSSAVVSLDSTEPFVTKVGMLRHKNSLYMLIAYQWFSWVQISVSIRKP